MYVPQFVVQGVLGAAGNSAQKSSFFDGERINKVILMNLFPFCSSFILPLKKLSVDSVIVLCCCCQYSTS